MRMSKNDTMYIFGLLPEIKVISAYLTCILFFGSCFFPFVLALMLLHAKPADSVVSGTAL